jgi:hypothetical protein
MPNNRDLITKINLNIEEYLNKKDYPDSKLFFINLKNDITALNTNLPTVKISKFMTEDGEHELKLLFDNLLRIRDKEQDIDKLDHYLNKIYQSLYTLLDEMNSRDEETQDLKYYEQLYLELVERTPAHIVNIDQLEKACVYSITRKSLIRTKNKVEEFFVFQFGVNSKPLQVLKQYKKLTDYVMINIPNITESKNTFESFYSMTKTILDVYRKHEPIYLKNPRVRKPIHMIFRVLPVTNVINKIIGNPFLKDYKSELEGIFINSTL